MRAIGSLLVSGVVVLAGALAFAQQAEQPAPSYEDTVRYVQERLAGGLEETGHCSFVYHESDRYQSIQSFNAVDLSPRLSWREGSDWGYLNCTGGTKCVKEKLGGQASSREWAFEVKPDADRSKTGKALLHLLVLCGAQPAKPDLF